MRPAIARRLVPLLLGLLPAVPAPGGAIAWEPSYDAALERARAERRVVFVAVNMDGERANTTLAQETYRDERLIELSRRTVNLIASRYTHAEGSAPCPRFGGITCAQHRAVEVDVRRKVVKVSRTGHVVAPQHVFLDPEGKVLLSVPYIVSLPELEWCFVTALRKVDSDFPPTLPEAARPPARLLMGRVHDPDTEEDGPGAAGAVAPLSRKEVLALIAQAREGAPGRDKAALIRALLRTDEPEAIEFVKTELGARWVTFRGLTLLANTIHSIGVLSPASWWVVVAEHASHADDRVRSEVAVALEQLAAPQSLKEIREAYAREKDGAIRKEWLRAMGTAGADDRSTRSLLLKVARSEKDGTLRANALIALGSVAAALDVRRELERKLTSGTPRERRAAACAMALTRDPRYSDALQTASASEKDAAVAEALALALRVLEGEGLEILGDKVKEVAGDTIERERFFGGGGS